MRDVIVGLVRPTLPAMGYALFLAVNAAGVWGGVFPFLPLDFQTYDLLLWFYLAQAGTLFVTFFAGARLSFTGNGFLEKAPVLKAALPYFLGWCGLIAAIYVHDHTVELTVAGGALLGLGSGAFYLQWQRYFAATAEEVGERNMLTGGMYAAAIYFALYLIPRAITALLIPTVFLPLFSMALTLANRTIDPNQPMFQDGPRQNQRVYRRAFASMWRSALCLGGFALCTGLIRATAIESPTIGSLVNILSMAGLFVAGLAVLALWQLKGLRLNIVKLYQFTYPVVATAFLVLPATRLGYVRWLAAAVYALYSIGLLLMMLQCAQTSRARGVEPMFAYGMFGGIVYGMHDMGFIMGSIGHQITNQLVTQNTLVSLASVYLLGILFFAVTVNFRGTAPRLLQGDSIELVSAHPSAVPPRPKSVERVAEGERFHHDRVAKQVYLLQTEFRLSDREAEVVDLVVRGNTVARIAELLTVSENTVRTHMKRIYTKLSVHRKQELIELVERYDPSPTA
ncbi:helix-turn-helix transcriptional regulator [Denitrobacterium detoxificans]|jgi:DNA-binding CsgD family transcriptional regulator/MFS family permease|uniref:helix-turn-helix transcriptional regulator n=1 Tax=Denitrobacterium detoxificans TaxID=79604 RepID=UPI0026F2E089|nr:helix-turn-helix transcriptional regulator [Denitrobacterium detoxificans]MBE6466450.1 helix-turn-helix transcriptional regulator [Denitrobacterium detoxificans]